MRIGRVITQASQIVSSRCFIVVLTILLLGGLGNNAPALTNALLPDVQKIVQQAVNYAITQEDTNTARFNQHYHYTRHRNWLHHKETGTLTEFKQTTTEENTPPAGPDAGPRELLVKGRDLKFNSYPITNIVTRFDFTLIGESQVEGRPAYVIGFVPHKNLPVHHLKDPFINRATGTLWIDQQDYAIAKATFQLNSPVKAAYGVAGEINGFSGKITRARTSEGYWHVRRLEWHLDERILTARRTIDFYEERSQPLSHVRPVVDAGGLSNYARQSGMISE